MSESVSYQARTLSAGTVGVLIQSGRYDEIDAWRLTFYEWCLEHEGAFECWQEAWFVFGPLYGFGDGRPEWLKRRQG